MGKSIRVCLLIFTLLAVWSVELRAQALDHVQGEILVSLRSGADIQRLAKDMALFRSESTSFRVRKQITAPRNIWVCEFDFAKIHEGRLLEEVRRHPLVEAAQFNHFLDLRSTVPDDPQFDRQWQYLNTGQNNGLPGADLDMDLAWDLTTGGLTLTGDTIVVCVIDNGVDIRHEDLVDNLWINHAEVPGNGFDDDGNGFVDDYYGWNTATDMDKIDVEDDNHGTPVAGIIGARGNNDLGVSGINWNIKLMIVAGGTGLESEALEAFSYPLAQRRLYNRTNGREGAFVVATNASWGRDFGDPEDFPLWCAVYDTLGAEGIINVAATANENADVDEEGDMPTGCISDFLIGVTSIDRNNEKPARAAYGQISVDIGAYGEEVWTLKKGNDYGRFMGTSAATPHVAGAVALLYSASCPNLVHLAQFDPAAAALAAKRYLLEGTLATPSLEGRTLTGGRLNINNALQAYIGECGSCPLPAGLKATALTEESATLTWLAADEVNKADLRWRLRNTGDWTVVRNALPSFKLEDLSSCTEYEFQIKVYCGETELDYTPSLVFRTEGCCERPRRFRLTARNDRNAVVQWDAETSAIQYVVRLQRLNDGDSKVISTKGNIAFFNGLEACVDYQAQIRTVCADGSTDFGETLTFSTLGCGACFDLPYCKPTNADASEEWIAEVSLNTLDNFSGPDDGYGNFTGMPSTQLVAGESYPISITPGFAGNELFEYFQAWIDLDQDGVFGSDELLFDPGGVSRTTVTGNIEVPADAARGKTRLRVMMKFRDPAGPCGFIDRPFGEYEDYCIAIVDEEESCSVPGSFEILTTGPSRAEFQWKDDDGPGDYFFRYREKGEPEWQTLTLQNNRLNLEQLSPCTEYEAQVKTICGEFYGAFTELYTFKTNCSTAGETIPAEVGDLQVFPNPFRNDLTLDLYLRNAQRNLRVVLFDNTGRQVLSRSVDLPAGKNAIFLDGSRVPSGVYWIVVRPESGPPVSKKAVKVN